MEKAKEPLNKLSSHHSADFLACPVFNPLGCFSLEVLGHDKSHVIAKVDIIDVLP